jgi:hypothetical protein
MSLPSLLLLAAPLPADASAPPEGTPIAAVAGR